VFTAKVCMTASILPCIMSKTPLTLPLPAKFLSPLHSSGASSVSPASLHSYCVSIQHSNLSEDSLSGLSAYIEQTKEADDTMREDLSGMEGSGRVVVEENSELYQQFSLELRSAKTELAQLYRENKQLHLQIDSQEQQIKSLHALYKHQAQSLRRELAELRAAVGRVKLSDEDWQTKPTIETEEFTGQGEGRGSCCTLS